MSAQNTPFNPLTEPETATAYESNMVITTLSFPNAVVFVTREAIYQKEYSQQQVVAPVGQTPSVVKPLDGHEFVAASKRDSTTYFVLSKLVGSPAEFMYQIYGLGGQLQGQTKVIRDIVQAQAIEGTPIIACSHFLKQQSGYTGKVSKQQQVLTFSFDIFLNTATQGVIFKGIRLAKSHSDATDFIQTVYFNCIRVTEGKAILCARKPCASENAFSNLVLETKISKDQAALLLSCIHLCSGKTSLVYRDYVFKVRSGNGYEIMCEITKQMTFSAAGTPVSRLIGFSCGAAYTSLLYNSFGAVTAYGDLLVYQFNKHQPVQKVRLQQQSQFITLCNFNNSLLCVADGESITFYGVDGQFNDFPGLQKFYQQLCTDLAPVVAQVAGGTEESAKYLCQMNLIPQGVFQQLNLDQGTRILNPLTKITLPFSVSQVSADAKNLIISGRGRSLLFSLDQLRNQFKYDYLVQKCGDFLGNFCQQFEFQTQDALQILQQKGLLSNQPIQDTLIDPDNASEATTLAVTAQTPLTATNQLRASSPVHNITDILADNHFDELSALRNSQADVPVNMTGTRGLIELGNLVAAQDWESGKQVDPVQNTTGSTQAQSLQVQGSGRQVQGSFNGAEQLLSRGAVSMSQYATAARSAADQQSTLQAEALEAAKQATESMSQQLATRESQLKRSQELLSQLFGSLAQSGVETLDLQRLVNGTDAKAFMNGVAGVFGGRIGQISQDGLLGALDKCLGPELSYAIARSCAFRPAHGVSPSTETIDQQFYHGNQVFKLFQVAFESSYLLPCGHVSKRATSRIVLNLNEEAATTGSRSPSPTSTSSVARAPALQQRLMSLFKGQFVQGNDADEVITCRQCRQQTSVDGCHEELYNVNLPMKLLVFGDAPLLQRLQFELNGVEHSYVLQAVINEQNTQIFSLDDHGDWFDVVYNAPAAFSAIQQQFSGSKCFAVYTKPAVNDVRLTQETFKAIVEAFSDVDSSVLNSQTRKTQDQLNREFSELQRHDMESQKIIQNQIQTIQKLQLQLKDIQESLKTENISELSLSDLIRQNSAFRQENEELKGLTQEQEKQINVLVAENEQLQQQLSTKMTNFEAEQIVRQCLELMGARNIPRYGEELFRQLQNQCMAVQAERKILRSGDIATSGPGSLLNSQNIVSNYTGNKCYECLLPALAVVFALILVGLFALVLMDSL